MGKQGQTGSGEHTRTQTRVAGSTLWHECIPSINSLTASSDAVKSKLRRRFFTQSNRDTRSAMEMIIQRVRFLPKIAFSYLYTLLFYNISVYRHPLLVV